VGQRPIGWDFCGPGNIPCWVVAFFSFVHVHVGGWEGAVLHCQPPWLLPVPICQSSSLLKPGSLQHTLQLNLKWRTTQSRRHTRRKELGSAGYILGTLRPRSLCFPVPT